VNFALWDPEYQVVLYVEDKCHENLVVVTDLQTEDSLSLYLGARPVAVCKADTL